MQNHGAREVGRSELAQVPTPAGSRTWRLISHIDFLNEVDELLKLNGFTVTKERHALSRSDCRYFGILDLKVEIAPGVTLICGVRNSTDQSFPMGFSAGHRVLTSDSAAFSMELMAKRKHSLLGIERFRSDIGLCVSKLDEFRKAEQSRIERMINTPVNDIVAESLMLRGLEKHLISPRLIYQLIRSWRNPSFEEFKDRNMWSLYNCFTSTLANQAKRVPDKHARATMQLGLLLTPIRITDETAMERMESAKAC